VNDRAAAEPTDSEREAKAGAFPGARAPERERRVDAHGVGIHVVEWGDPDGPVLLLGHGGFDFARTYDVFAPLLADAGWRVVSWDHRGHGDSEHAALYSWDADVRDALAVLDSTTDRPVAVIGHSKAGGLLTQLIEACPGRVTKFVNIDGLPSPRPHPDVAEHERVSLVARELAARLDHRRRAATLLRKPGTLDELAERRGRMNPRLSREWLRHLVSVGARRDPDGWRWKIDPTLRFGGFGPWRPEWSLERMPRLGVPMLGIIGLEPEAMGWGTSEEEVRPYLPRDSELVAMHGVGHFVHIERPQQVAELALRFLS
jgi:pimeloyl-ACP methyl ester carboxylesterase